MVPEDWSIKSMVEINVCYQNPKNMELTKHVKQTPISDLCNVIEKQLTNEYFVFEVSNDSRSYSTLSGGVSSMMLTDVHSHSKYAWLVIDCFYFVDKLYNSYKAVISWF